MSRPKSTVIHLTSDVLCDIEDVWDTKADRVARPGKHKVWREGDKIYLEVFHNEP